MVAGLVIILPIVRGPIGVYEVEEQPSELYSEYWNGSAIVSVDSVPESVTLEPENGGQETFTLEVPHPTTVTVTAI